jgi:hypothetical protein
LYLQDGLAASAIISAAHLQFREYLTTQRRRCITSISIAVDVDGVGDGALWIGGQIFEYMERKICNQSIVVVIDVGSYGHLVDLAHLQQDAMFTVIKVNTYCWCVVSCCITPKTNNKGR